MVMKAGKWNFVGGLYFFIGFGFSDVQINNAKVQIIF